MDWIRLIDERGQVAGCCERGNNRSDFIYLGILVIRLVTVGCSRSYSFFQACVSVDNLAIV